MRTNIGSLAIDGILWNNGVFPQQGTIGPIEPPPPPATVPEPPTNLRASAGNGSATISFTAGSDGGSAITNYQYLQNGGFTWISLDPSDNTTPITITGLTNGTLYTFYLKAVNSVGASRASSSVTVRPVGPPSPPTSLSAATSSGRVAISFIAGATGGSAITNYAYSKNGVRFIEFSPPVTTSPVTIDGFINGVTYVITLKAINAVGESVSASAPITFTPNPAVRTFTTPSTAWTAPAGVTSLDYLVVGGGGGGGGAYDNSAGGGGGGGLALSGTTAVTPGVSYTITVGAGGAGAVRPTYPNQNDGSPGNASSIGSLIVAGGGGFGYKSRYAASGTSIPAGGVQASGLIAPTGGSGGNGVPGLAGSGGGGNTSNGTAGVVGTAGSGGDGLTDTISGNAVTYGAGGAGGVRNTGSAGTAGAANTGNGGQGGGSPPSNNIGGANGGSGIVIIRY